MKFVKGLLWAIFFSLAIYGAIALAYLGITRAEERVSVALVIAMDISSSVNDERHRLQREGTAEALVHSVVLDAIRGTERGRIAVAVIEWAGSSHQAVLVPWTIIETREDAVRVAQRLLRQERAFGGSTSISGAIDFAVGLFAAAPPAARMVIDVSGDGANNDGRLASIARDEAVARGVTINGLAIMEGHALPMGEAPDVHYREQVIGGNGAFLLVVDSFDSFAHAMRGKLEREVAGLPVMHANVRDGRR